MTWLLSILFIFQFPAFGQSGEVTALDSEVFADAPPRMNQLDIANYDAYHRDRTFKRDGGTEFPILKQDLTVKIKPQSPLFALPGYVNKPALVRDAGRDTCQMNSALDGKLLWVAGRTMAVELSQGEDFCGNKFNSNVSPRNIVFVSTENMASIHRTEDLQTEAGFPLCDGPACRENALTELQATLLTQSMARTCPQAPDDWKTPAQMEGYLKCYPTRYQSDYDTYYKKLIELAAQKFNVAYRSDADESVVPIIDSSTFELVDEDAPGRPVVDREKLPVFVSANANVMKCVSLRESRWDKEARSSAGTGIGQQTYINAKDINEFMAANRWAKDLWDSYFINAKKSFTASEWAKVTTHPKTGKPCTQEMRTVIADNKETAVPDAYCPVNSIAAMALYQVMVELRIRQANPNYRDKAMTQAEFADIGLLGALGHNAGITSVSVAAKTGTPEQWVERVVAQSNSPERVKEKSDYRKFMQRCLSGQNWEPIDNGKPADCTKLKPPPDKC